MEQEELINEKNELFESFKREFSKRARISPIEFVIICLFVGLFIYSAVRGNMNWLSCTIGSILLLGAGCYDLIWLNKITKAGNAQEFLTLHDKNRKVYKWMLIISLILLIVIFTIEFISDKDMGSLIWFGALLVLSIILRPWQDPYKDKKDIERLRKLVQQS